MRFTNDARDGLQSGTITLTFRNWKRPQVKVRGRYRTQGVVLEVTGLARVTVGDVSDEGARAAGFADRTALTKFLGLPDSAEVYRVDFVRTSEEPPRRVRDLDDATITVRLDRLDAASPLGPWTRKVLEMIAAQPATRAADLAAQVGRERMSFKEDVRKLKRLGLTESLEVGYRLSPRGRAYLEGRRDLSD